MLRLLVTCDDHHHHLDIDSNTAESKSDSWQWQWWNQYVACFETIEMEQEPHLMDQVWNTVEALAEHAAALVAAKTMTTMMAATLSSLVVWQQQQSQSPEQRQQAPPVLTWDWMTFFVCLHVYIARIACGT